MAKKPNFFIIVDLNNIFIYIKDLRQSHKEIVRCVLDILQRHRLFANIKKYQFHKNKFCFLGYIILALKVRIKNKQTRVIKN